MAFRFNFERSDIDEGTDSCSKRIKLNDSPSAPLPAAMKPIDTVIPTAIVSLDWTLMVCEEEDWETEKIHVNDGLVFTCIWPQAVEQELAHISTSDEEDSPSEEENSSSENELSSENDSPLQNDISRQQKKSQIQDTSVADSPCNDGAAVSISQDTIQATVNAASESSSQNAIDCDNGVSDDCTLSSLEPAGEGSVEHYSKHSASPPSSNSLIVSAVKNHSDLVAGIYEGGLKIWECSLDLTDYLQHTQTPLQGKHVLELGCGAGLPGLYALISGAHVTFQDYNAEVLRLITARNVLLNARDSTSKAVFVSGAWTDLASMLLSQCPHKYDMILTSETIYSRTSYKALLDLMKEVLAPQGIIYLAAKTYYFGVGGGLRDFEEFVCTDGVFTSQVCKEYSEGMQREILKITFTSDATAH